MAAQVRIRRQAEAMAYPAARRRVRCGGGLEQVCCQPVEQKRDGDQQAGLGNRGVKVSRQRGVAGKREPDRRQDDDAQQKARDRPPRAADHLWKVGGLGPGRLPGTVGQGRQREQSHDAGQKQGADRRHGLARRAAMGERHIDEVEREAHHHQATDSMRQQTCADVGKRQDPPFRPAGRKRRGGHAEHQQQHDEAGHEFRQQLVEGRGWHTCRQQLADQPDCQDRHQHQPQAIDGGRDGAVARTEIVGVTAPETIPKFSADPPQRDRDRRPDGQ